MFRLLTLPIGNCILSPKGVIRFRFPWFFYQHTFFAIEGDLESSIGLKAKTLQIYTKHNFYYHLYSENAYINSLLYHHVKTACLLVFLTFQILRSFQFLLEKSFYEKSVFKTRNNKKYVCRVILWCL